MKHEDIHWHLTPQDDWEGTSLVDQSGLTHATFTGATPEALSLIEAAPALLRAVKWGVEQIADDLDPDHQEAIDDCRRLIREVEGGEYGCLDSNLNQ